MTIMYGINNCDTIKKARKWLTLQQQEFEFFDFKKQGLSAALLQQFITLNGWQNLINKRSTSYRNLSTSIKQNLTDELAFKAVLAQPTLLKRPLLIHHNHLYLGFSEQQYQAIFSS